MLETLRTEPVRIHLELSRCGGEADEDRTPISRKGGTYYPAPYEFVFLRIRFVNLSRKPIPLWQLQSLVLTKRPVEPHISPPASLDCGRRSRSGRSCDTGRRDVGHTGWTPRTQCRA